MHDFLLALLLLLLASAIWCIAVHNRLVRRRQHVLNALSQIEVQLARRHQLIPALVESVKGYMHHERATLEAVIRARAEAVSALGRSRSAAAAQAMTAMLPVAAAEDALTNALHGVVGTVEAYPDLKAHGQIRTLMEELRSTEHRVAFARQHANDMIAEMNSLRDAFPHSLVATMAGFSAMPFLEFADRSILEVPAVSLDRPEGEA